MPAAAELWASMQPHWRWTSLQMSAAMRHMAAISVAKGKHIVVEQGRRLASPGAARGDAATSH